MTAIEGVNTTQNGRLAAVEASVAGLDSTYATDAALSGAIASLEAADASIASDVADEVSAREAAVAAVAGDLSSEVARAEAAEGALDSRLDSVEGTLAALDATYATEVEVAAAVAVETAAREAADTALDGRVDTIEANYTRKYAVAVGNGSATSFTVTHNLGTSDVVVSVREVATGAVVVASVTHTSDSVVTVAVNEAPASNALKVVVIG
jgi:hypothetical protein